jgi:hypothetical protein
VTSRASRRVTRTERYEFPGTGRLRSVAFASPFDFMIFNQSGLADRQGATFRGEPPSEGGETASGDRERHATPMAADLLSFCEPFALPGLLLLKGLGRSPPATARPWACLGSSLVLRFLEDYAHLEMRDIIRPDSGTRTPVSTACR